MRLWFKKKKNSFEAVMRLQYLYESGMPLVASTLFQNFNWECAFMTFMCAFLCFPWKHFCISRH